MRGIVGLDCEFVGVGKNTIGIGGDRNALGRLSLVSYSGDALIDTFVRVDEPVVDYRIHITGLSQQNLDAGISFAEARQLAAALMEGRIVVGHSLVHDFKVLAIDHPKSFVRDTQSCAHLKIPAGARSKIAAGGRSLKALCQHHLGNQIQDGIHCSVEDAWTAVQLYKCVEESWDPYCPIEDRVQAPSQAPSHLCRSAQILRDTDKGENEDLAMQFDNHAKLASGYAREHYLRAARTIRFLPFTLKSTDDLKRPELRCIGQGKVRTMLEGLL